MQNTTETKLWGHERVGKYTAHLTHADHLGADPLYLDIPDFDTEAEARTYALAEARRHPRANRVLINRIERDTFTRGLYQETVDQIESTDAAWTQEETAQTPSPAEAPSTTGASRHMLRAATRTRRNTLRTAVKTSRALAYRTLSGIIAALVDTGRLIRTGDFLNRVGGGNLKDGQQSWFGRHVAKAYRAQHGGDTVKVWTQHQTTGKWIHVYAYNPIDEALYAGLRSYKGTRHILAETYARCA
jgi:hypothetical protein